jgi:hypothetical protein
MMDSVAPIYIITLAIAARILGWQPFRQDCQECETNKKVYQHIWSRYISEVSRDTKYSGYIRDDSDDSGDSDDSDAVDVVDDSGGAVDTDSDDSNVAGATKKEDPHDLKYLLKQLRKHDIDNMQLVSQTHSEEISA